MTEQFCPIVSQRNHFNFGATQIDTNTHNFSPQFSTTTNLPPSVAHSPAHATLTECDTNGNSPIWLYETRQRTQINGNEAIFQRQFVIMPPCF